MRELESRIIAASVVQALRARGATVREITVEPRQGGGIRLRAELDGPVVQCDVPRGYFAYDQVAAALIQATGRCQLETK